MMIEVRVAGVEMSFRTEPALFSPNRADPGTLAMLSCAAFEPGDKVLDLGCGYGLVGIYAAKVIGDAAVTMSDSSETAVAAARENAARNGVPGIAVLHSDGFEGIDDAGYSLILSNPPYHTDFSVAKRFIEKGFNRLRVGGRMIMVTKRKEWYKKKLISIFGGVAIREIDGYFVFIAEKRGERYANRQIKATLGSAQTCQRE